MATHPLPDSPTAAFGPRESKRPTSYFYRHCVGVWSLSKREILRFLIVFQQTILPPLVSSALFMLIFGVSVGKHLEFSGESANNYLTYIIPGLMTMHLISSCFENTSFSLFIARWHNHIQEILLSPLSYFEMVLGFLVGGISRGIITLIGVFGVALLFVDISIEHPWLLVYFILTIATLFSCGGLLAALWAENFGMLSVWNIYVIMPAVFLGGVFNPVSMIPGRIQWLVKLNPMYYLVSGMRYSLLGHREADIRVSVLISFFLSVFLLILTVHLFRKGYKLRS